MKFRFPKDAISFRHFAWKIQVFSKCLDLFRAHSLACFLTSIVTQTFFFMFIFFVVAFNNTIREWSRVVDDVEGTTKKAPQKFGGWEAEAGRRRTLRWDASKQCLKKRKQALTFVFSMMMNTGALPHGTFGRGKDSAVGRLRSFLWQKICEAAPPFFFSCVFKFFIFLLFLRKGLQFWIWIKNGSN